MTPTRTVAQALAVSPAAALLARVEAAQRISALLGPECARLRLGFDAATPGRFELREKEVLINLDSAAQAAKLRQALPRLTQTLQQKGFGAYGIKLRVQPPGGRDEVIDLDPSRYGPPRDPSAGGARAVHRLALELPLSDLRSALEKLEQTLGRLRG
ncbi:MAG: hypothetical protein RR101_00215 [Burkholderiaceae bacterium]